jgi:hypothetical protein
MALRTRLVTLDAAGAVSELDFASNGITPASFTEKYTNRIELSTTPQVEAARVKSYQRGSATLSVSGALNFDNKKDLQDKKTLLRASLSNQAKVTASQVVPTLQQRIVFYRHFTDVVEKRWVDCACVNLSFDNTSRTVRHVPFSFTLVSPSGLRFTGNAGSDSTTDQFEEDITAAATVLLKGPVILDDDEGKSYFSIRNSDGDSVFQIDSEGTVSYAGILEQVSSISL